MTKPITFTTPGGDTMVILPLSEYEALIGGHDDPEDVADVAAFDAAMARLEAGEDRPLTSDEMTAFYMRPAVLRGLRKGRNLTHSALARRAGVATALVREIEAGHRLAPPDAAPKLVAALLGDAERTSAQA